MDERKYESRFIPCGDSLEKMEEIAAAACEAEKQAEKPETCPAAESE